MRTRSINDVLLMHKLSVARIPRILRPIYAPTHKTTNVIYGQRPITAALDNSYYLFMLHIGFGAQHSQHKRACCVHIFLPESVQIK